MAAAVAKHGYAATTIADVVQRARVSKRTFYEHYRDKEACFLATCSNASKALFSQVEKASEQAAPSEALEAALRAYFSALEAQRGLSRAFFSELPAVGPAALALRRQMQREFAALLRAVVERARSLDGKTPALATNMSIALVGAINELVWCAVARERRAQPPMVAAYADTAIALCRAALHT